MVKMPGGGIASKAPLVNKTLHERLAILGRQAQRGVDQTAWVGCIPGFFTAWAIAHFLTTIISALLAAATKNEYLLIPILVIPPVMGILGAIGIVHLLRIGCRRLYRRYYLATWNELFSTNMMAMVVDEDYTRLLRERAEDIWALKWISPPLPSTIEHQLEYAACYHLAIRRMLRGVSRLDNTPLWQGGVAYYAGLRGGVACGCLLFFILSWLAIPVWIIAGVYYIQRCAALAAYCDYLLYEADAL
jgi:hypothetical protein